MKLFLSESKVNEDIECPNPFLRRQSSDKLGEGRERLSNSLDFSSNLPFRLF